MDPKGTHIIMDLHGCGRVNPPDGFFNDLATICGFEVLDVRSRDFAGGGLTTYAMLSQGHSSIHLWPAGVLYVAFDLFSGCRLSKVEVSKATEFVKKAFKAESEETTVVDRE